MGTICFDFIRKSLYLSSSELKQFSSGVEREKVTNGFPENRETNFKTPLVTAPPHCRIL